MVQLNTPQPAEIVVITCLLFILYRVACGLVPRHPRIVDLFCGLILGIAGLAGAVAAAVGKVDPFVDPKFALTGEI